MRSCKAPIKRNLAGTSVPCNECAGRSVPSNKSRWIWYHACNIICFLQSEGFFARLYWKPITYPCHDIYALRVGVAFSIGIIIQLSTKSVEKACTQIAVAMAMDWSHLLSFSKSVYSHLFSRPSDGSGFPGWAQGSSSSHCASCYCYMHQGLAGCNDGTPAPERPLMFCLISQVCSHLEWPVQRNPTGVTRAAERPNGGQLEIRWTRSGCACAAMEQRGCE